jgi:Fe-S cluster assembly protein SufD
MVHNQSNLLNSNSMTTATATIPGFDSDVFEAFVTSQHEPDWIQAKRREAFDVLREKYASELDPEEWKRVDLRTFRPGRFSIQTSASDATFETLLQDRAEFGGNVAHVDGHCTKSLLDPEIAKQGVLFGSLTQLLAEHRETLEPHLMTRAVNMGQDRFTAWNAAYRTGGTILYVPRNVEVKQPLYSLIGLATDGAADFSHTLVILEDGASAALLEETVSANADIAGLHIGAVELLVGRRAHLRYVQLQNWNQKTYHIAHQAGRVDEDASLQWTVGGLGAKLAHIHQHVTLDGRGSDAQVNGVTFATDRQLLSYYTQQTHNAPNTHSDLLYKQVLRDRARVVWRGMIKVDEIAQKTDGYQRCDALMLSPDARCDLIPGLEIEADDVRCTHGATTGRVDDEQIFYTMSRGMTKFEAMHMIVEGFFHQVYDRIPIQAVRETLSQAVEQKLGIGD